MGLVRPSTKSLPRVESGKTKGEIHSLRASSFQASSAFNHRGKVKRGSTGINIESLDISTSAGPEKASEVRIREIASKGPKGGGSTKRQLSSTIGEKSPVSAKIRLLPLPERENEIRTDFKTRAGFGCERKRNLEGFATAGQSLGKGGGKISSQWRGGDGMNGGARTRASDERGNKENR